MFGPERFLSIYLGAGILANTATFIAGSAPYSLGASGSTFGLLGALGTYYYVNRGVLGGRSRSGKRSYCCLTLSYIISVLWNILTLLVCISTYHPWLTLYNYLYELSPFI